MSKRAKEPTRTTVGYGYVGVWRNGDVGWFMPRHVWPDPGQRYAPSQPAEDPNAAGDMAVLCKITIEPVPGARRRRFTNGRAEKGRGGR